MGVITISRIASQIIAIFSLDRDIKSQFKFFNDVRFFPNKIFACINKVDLVKGDLDKILEEVKNEISAYFGKRKINVENFFVTCAETVQGFEKVKEYNDAVCEMILNIITTS